MALDDKGYCIKKIEYFTLSVVLDTFGPFWTLLLHLRNETQNFRADFRIDPVVSAGICSSMDGISPLIGANET
ncbi:hypothetical protein AcV7_002504 [Taiwanofungus camphoratus]|nr:hypothetical protein AcV7_002504 [Antrodia cinnamomea]